MLSGLPGVNNPPAGADKTVTTLENTTYTFTAADFGFTDPDQQWIPSGAPSASNLTADHVLVLYNTASAAGIQIANYYAEVHPGVHLLGINGVDPTNETVTADFYLSTIRPQVLASLTSSIDVIVTTNGLPLRIAVTEPAVSSYVDPYGMARIVFQWRPYSSLESELTRVDFVSSWQMMGDQTYYMPNHYDLNPYYLASSSFDHATLGTRLTARLDGYTVADVLASIDRAQQAFVGPNNYSDGPTYFLVDNDPSKSYGGYMAKLVNDVLNPAGLPVVYDNTSAFVGSAPGPIIGYDSHGVHQASTPANYLLTGLTAALANGAVFESWESFNAYSFDPNSTVHINQGQVGQWLQIGGTAAVGHVEEPTASSSTVTNEDQMFRMLLAGYTFAESAWSANKQLSFVNTVVGDPLMTWQRLTSGSNELAAVKITTLPTASTLTLSGVALMAGQYVSAADIAAGLLRFTPVANANGSNYANFTFQVQDNGGTAGGGIDLDSTPNTITVDVTAVTNPPSSILARHIFYNASFYDGKNSAINALDDNAIAIDKVAYLPAADPATFANISSYSKGINGIMIDVAGAHGTISADDFVFKVGNNNVPSAWATAPDPISISVRAGAGANGSDRVTIIWANYAIRKTWLEVMTLANADTGLPQLAGYPAGYGDVFYFGNAVGDSGLGDTATLATVDATDELEARNHPATLLNNIPITNLYDFNRDAMVDTTDQLIARNNSTNLLTATKYLNLVVGSFAPQGGGAQVTPLASNTDNTGIAVAPMMSLGDSSSTVAVADLISSRTSPGEGSVRGRGGAVVQAVQQIIAEIDLAARVRDIDDDLESLLADLRLA